MAAGRENFIFFLCPLDGVRFIYRFGGRFCYSDVFVESPGFMGLDAATSE